MRRGAYTARTAANPPPPRTAIEALLWHKAELTVLIRVQLLRPLRIRHQQPLQVLHFFINITLLPLLPPEYHGRDRMQRIDPQTEHHAERDVKGRGY